MSKMNFNWFTSVPVMADLAAMLEVTYKSAAAKAANLMIAAPRRAIVTVAKTVNNNYSLIITAGVLLGVLLFLVHYKTTLRKTDTCEPQPDTPMEDDDAQIRHYQGKPRSILKSDANEDPSLFTFLMPTHATEDDNFSFFFHVAFAKQHPFLVPYATDAMENERAENFPAEVRSWWEERVEKDPIPSHEATRNGAYASRVSLAILKCYVDDIQEAWDYHYGDFVPATTQPKPSVVKFVEDDITATFSSSRSNESKEWYASELYISNEEEMKNEIGRSREERGRKRMDSYCLSAQELLELREEVELFYPSKTASSIDSDDSVEAAEAVLAKTVVLSCSSGGRARLLEALSFVPSIVSQPVSMTAVKLCAVGFGFVGQSLVSSGVVLSGYGLLEWSHWIWQRQLCGVPWTSRSGTWGTLIVWILVGGIPKMDL